MKIEECVKGTAVLCSIPRLGVDYLGVIEGIGKSLITLEGLDPVMMGVGAGSLSHLSISQLFEFKSKAEAEIKIATSDFDRNRLAKLIATINRNISEAV